MKEGGEARSSEGGGGRRRAKVQGWSWMEEKSRGVEGGRLQTARRRRNETGGTGRKEAEKRGGKRNRRIAEVPSESLTVSVFMGCVWPFPCVAAGGPDRW